jgi:hypothetical protein
MHEAEIALWHGLRPANRFSSVGIDSTKPFIENVLLTPQIIDSMLTNILTKKAGFSNGMLPIS